MVLYRFVGLLQLCAVFGWENENEVLMQMKKVQLDCSQGGCKPDLTLPVTKHFEVGKLNSGIACLGKLDAIGLGFIMFSREAVRQRWTETKRHRSTAEHFACVVYDEGWKYDTMNERVPFEPQDDDLLMATFDLGGDVATSLVADTFKAGIHHGIAIGYSTGDLTFTYNQYNGISNAGEFDVNGTGFDVVTGSGGLPTYTDQVFNALNGVISWEAVDANVKSPFVIIGDFVKLPDGQNRGDGFIEFAMNCDSQLEGLSLDAYVLTPNGGDDSFFLQVAGSEQVAWHTARKHSPDWGWSKPSPTFALSAGYTSIKLLMREDGAAIRTLRLKGHKNCVFVKPEALTLHRR